MRVERVHGVRAVIDRFERTERPRADADVRADVETALSIDAMMRLLGTSFDSAGGIAREPTGAFASVSLRLPEPCGATAGPS